MQVNEIFSNISSHFIQGLMIHSQLISFYNFLGLCGIAEQHKYHYYSESKSYIELNEYYTTHYNELIPENFFENRSVIPETWFSKNRQEISPNDIPRFIEKGINEWIKWEQLTKKLLQQMYTELILVGEIAASKFLMQYIEDVDEELASAEAEKLLLTMIDYDMTRLADEDKEKLKTYKKKIKEIYKNS